MMIKRKKILDLHSIKHSNALLLIEQFIHENRNELPIKIITGNSRKMKNIVISSAKEMGYNVFDIGKFGEIDIY